MSSILSYVKSQLKQKFVQNPLISFLSFISPVIIFLICFILGKCMNFEDNDHKIVSMRYIFIITVSYFICIVLVFNAAYDIINEKNKYRKQHMYAHGFNLIKFHISWVIIYALILLPTSIIIAAIIHFTNIFPGISISIIFLVFYFTQLSFITVGFWVSSFFSYSTFGGLISTLVPVAVAITFFCVTYFVNYKSSRPYYGGQSLLDRIIFEFKAIIIHNESFGLSNLFSAKHKQIPINLFSTIGSILLMILLTIFTDSFFISKHVKRSFSERKSQSYFKELFKNSPTTKVRQVPRKEAENNEGFFDWSEMNQLFKVKKDEYKNVYEEENNNVQQDSNNNGKENISVEKVFKMYNSSNDLAIKNASFKIYSNEITVITGPPDSGKSTLMKMLYGYQSSSYGSIIIKGKEMNHKNWKAINKYVSVAPKEDYALMEHLSVRDNIKLYASMYSTKENGISILNELNFNGSSTDIIKNLDDVEKTKVKVALALLKSTPCVFIEEPTAIMSDKDVECFWNAIKSRKNKRSIIVSTLSMYEALTYGDRIIVLKDGDIRCVGNREFIKSRLSTNENEPELNIRVN